MMLDQNASGHEVGGTDENDADGASAATASTVTDEHAIEVEPSEWRVTREGTKLREAEHAAVHRRLLEYARQRAALDAAEAYDLVRAEAMKVYALWGSPTMLDYLERYVGYAPHTARERLRVARTLVKLPNTTTELARGTLKFSAIRELTRVATAATEDEWLAKAKGKTVRQIEELVAGHAVGDRPDDPTRPDLVMRPLRLELPPECHALWREARKKLADERCAEVSDSDLFETVLRA